MITATYTKHFQKTFKKKDKVIQKEVLEKIRIFRQEPFHVSLKNHKLHGEYAGYNSINVTGDFRAIFKYLDEDAVVFSYLGTHSELYE